MLKTYIKLAWRNFIEDKQFTMLNLVGLSTGLACVLLIYLWVIDELSVDQFNKNDDRLFQVIKTAPNADGTIAYRVHIEAGLFTLSAACVIIITLITISFQTIKAAVGNPVESLRME